MEAAFTTCRIYMYKTITRFFIALLAFVSFACHAEWITADGKASLVNQDPQTARDEAINDAIRSALLQVGAPISPDQAMKDGKAAPFDFRRFPNKAIKSVTVMSEEMTDNSIRVSIRVFIDAAKIQQCKASRIKKVILPIKLQYLDHNAYQGSNGIDTINEEISNMLFSDLSEAKTLLLKPRVNKLVHLASEANVLTADLQKNLSSLAQTAKAQYVIFGSIRSVAPSAVGSNVITRALYQQTRSIDFTLTIYDAYKQNILYHKNFAGEADWEYKQGEYVDLRSNRFRNSSYGSRLTQLVKYASDEIVGLIQCEDAEAAIIHVDGDYITINQGAHANIQEGDVFEVQHRSTFLGSDNYDYISKDPKQYKYKVTVVYPDAARLEPVDFNDALVNPRINDMVRAITQ